VKSANIEPRRIEDEKLDQERRAVAILCGLQWGVSFRAAPADVKDYEFQLVQSEVKKEDGDRRNPSVIAKACKCTSLWTMKSFPEEATQYIQEVIRCYGRERCARARERGRRYPIADLSVVRVDL
jgi:hypothetical protein